MIADSAGDLSVQIDSCFLPRAEDLLNGNRRFFVVQISELCLLPLKFQGFEIEIEATGQKVRSPKFSAD
jgi:hypothetical protein